MRNILILQLLLAGVSAEAQIKAPPLVATAFAKRFAAAKNVKWGKENAKEYEADFQLLGTKMSANFDLEGNWKETETVVTAQDLPAAVLQSIKARYPTAIISGGDKVERPVNNIIYEVNIKTAGGKKEVELFPDGKFIK